MEEMNDEVPVHPLRKVSHHSVSVIKELQKPKKIKGYAKHIVIIRDEAVTYKCTICSKTFKSKSNCSYHKHCADEVDKRFQCTICDRKFVSKAHFSYHNLTHTGANPFQCTVCQKAFKTKNKLLRHNQVHSDKQKKFSCDICGKLFLRKSSINIHKRYHTGEKPYQCNDCPKAFRAKKNLIFHLSSHTGIKNWICEICGKSYSIKWELELHKRVHTRYRPYQCPFSNCQQSFSQNRYLKRHMETHKNSIKYVCSLCEKVFSRKDNLQRHILNSHLDSQLNSVSENDKSKKLQNTAAYIQTIKMINSEENRAHELTPVLRTESVIKSVTEAGGIVNFSEPRVKVNRVSVIHKVCVASNNESALTTILTSDSIREDVIENNYQHVEQSSTNFIENEITPSSSAEYCYLTPVAAENLLPSDTAILSQEVSCNGAHVEDLSEEFVRSRCFLPKKIIAASYRDMDFVNEVEEKNGFTLKRSLDTYKLLDLSMRSHE